MTLSDAQGLIFDHSLILARKAFLQRNTPINNRLLSLSPKLGELIKKQKG